MLPAAAVNARSATVVAWERLVRGIRVQPGGRVVSIWQRANRLQRYSLAARGKDFGRARALGLSAPAGPFGPAQVLAPPGTFSAPVRRRRGG